MRKTSRKMLSLILVLMMAMSMIGAAVSVSYAATPQVQDFCGDMWLWPGGSANAWVVTDQAMTSVTLQVLESGNWQTFGTCTATDSYKDQWLFKIETTDSDEGKAWELRFALKYSGGTIYSPRFSVRVTTELGMDRIYGANRFDTAIQTSYIVGNLTVPYESPESYKNVVIASGVDFADALGGTYLASLYEAPILLVNRSTAVMDMIAKDMNMRLNTYGTVFILGGDAAVSKYMETALAQNGVSGSRVVRFEGANRYETNLQILKYCGLSADEIMVCSGLDFADALSASALGYPILLVGKGLTDSQKNYLSSLNPNNFDYVNMAGGTAAVPESVRDWFKANGFTTWRYAGSNRYHTSYMLAYDYIIHQSYYAFLAYSLDFPDGLSAGPLAYLLGAPLLLVNNSNYMYAEEFVFENDCRFPIAMGGPALISDATLKRVMTSEDMFASGAPAAVRGPGFAPFASDPELKPAPEWSKQSLGE